MMTYFHGSVSLEKVLIKRMEVVLSRKQAKLEKFRSIKGGSLIKHPTIMNIEAQIHNLESRITQRRRYLKAAS